MYRLVSELSEMVKQHLVAVHHRHVNLSRQYDAWKSLPQTQQNVKLTFHLTEQTHFIGSHYRNSTKDLPALT